jgi:hypothetical protein
MDSARQLIFSGVLSSMGLICAVWLWRQAPGSKSVSSNELLRGDRPWRRLGAALVALVAVAFFAGTNFLKAEQAPKVYVAFWCVVLVLIIWMCILALVDVRYTLRLGAQQLRRQARGQSQDAAGDDDD